MANGHGSGDSAIHVDDKAQLATSNLPRILAVGEGNGPAGELVQRGPQRGTGFLGGHAAQVDVADADAAGDALAFVSSDKVEAARGNDDGEAGRYHEHRHNDRAHTGSLPCCSSFRPC